MTRRMKWTLGLGVPLLLVLLGVGAVVGVVQVARWRAQAELAEAIAAVEALEPRWRLADVEADRRAVPDAQNSAVVLREAFAVLPAKWGEAAAVDEYEKVPPPVGLPDGVARRLAEELRAAPVARVKARTLEDLPFGRHRLKFAPDFISTLVADQQNVRPIARLLQLDVLQALHHRDLPRAWRSQRALLNAGRSLGDEPLLISMLVRGAIDTIAVGSLERILAQGELNDAQLKERQQALAEEANVPLFLTGMRGERAGNDHLMTSIETGQVRLMPFLDQGGSARAARPATAWDDVAEFFATTMVLRSHATLLHYETAMVEAAKLPITERYTELASIEAEVRAKVTRPGDPSQILARLLIPAVIRIAEAEQRLQSHLACGAAGVAAERYRLAHGHWPESLAELVRAGLLAEVPLDRFDGQPLRFRKTGDGIVIYSIGRERHYDGTALDDLATYDPSVSRVEFRLWDVPRRRQAALAP